MKTLWKYLKEFIRTDFNPWIYGWTLIFLAACITLNYLFNFQNLYIQKAATNEMTMLKFMLFYSFSYYLIAIPKLLISGQKQTLRKSEFWIKSLVMLALISIAGGFNYHKQWLNFRDADANGIFLIKFLTRLKCVFIYVLPLFILKFIYDKGQAGIYGLHFKKSSLKGYFIILLIVAPVVIAASFTHDFMEAYPRFKPWYSEDIYGDINVQANIILELVYGMDYVMVEFMFRGAFIIGMIAVMGKESVLPMVSVYCFLHFGKPLGESLGAIFGGYALGIIAYRTRQIWGGIIVHLGVAWLMEIMGFIQYYIFHMKR